MSKKDENQEPKFNKESLASAKNLKNSLVTSKTSLSDQIDKLYDEIRGYNQEKRQLEQSLAQIKQVKFDTPEERTSATKEINDKLELLEKRKLIAEQSRGQYIEHLGKIAQEIEALDLRISQLQSSQVQSELDKPTWLKETKEKKLDLVTEYKTLDKAAKADVHDKVEQALKEMKKVGEIQNFEPTNLGFKVHTSGNSFLNLDLVNSKITLSDFKEQTFEKAAKLAVSSGSTGIDIKHLDNPEARFSAWKTATNHNLQVVNLKPDEEQKFRKKLEEQQQTDSSVPRTPPV